MDVFRKYRPEFVEQLDSVSSIIDHLFADKLITRSNKNKILSEANPDNQIRELLDLIPKKGPKILKPFYDILKKTDNGELAKLLKPYINSGPTSEPKKTPPPVQHVSSKEYNCKVLVLHPSDENQEIKKYNQFNQDTCTRVLEKITTFASECEAFKTMVIFILGCFDGKSVEDILDTNKTYPITNICATLKGILPGKEKIGVLLRPENVDLTLVKDETPDDNCKLVALTEVRFNEFLKNLTNAEDIFPVISDFINHDEVLWCSPAQEATSHAQEEAIPGYILLLDGPKENKDVGDFLRKSGRNVKSSIDTCVHIENKLKDVVKESPKPAYFIVFLLGSFNGKEVEDVMSGNPVHITKICSELKNMLPQKRKICFLVQKDDTVKPEQINLDKDSDETVMVVALTNQRLIDLMKKLDDESDILSCIDTFVSGDEKIW